MIVVLTGGRDVGKTTVVSRTVSLLRDRGYEVAGFYCPDSASGKDLVAARTGERIPFAREGDAGPGEVGVGKYAIDRDAIARGIDLATSDGDVLVVDEIGRLEREGAGFAPVLADLDADSYGGILLSVRQDVVPAVQDSLPDDVSRVHVAVSEANRDGLAEHLVDTILEGVA